MWWNCGSNRIGSHVNDIDIVILRRKEAQQLEKKKQIILSHSDPALFIKLYLLYCFRTIQLLQMLLLIYGEMHSFSLCSNLQRRNTTNKRHKYSKFNRQINKHTPGESLQA